QSYRGRLEKDLVTEFLMGDLGGGWPPEVAFFPVITEGKVVALLYCDNAGTGEVFSETEGLEIFISQAGLALEKSLLQRKLQELQKDAGKIPPANA
ncbi:MAG TPA: GAF domain-containing protein, partial [Thermodesulfovibrionales bacterium]|nr:GAF domain-containing protein [Thermodesulfovibrionales bacterium]